MMFWIVEDGKLVEYKRLGECNRCGKCCSNTTITFSLGAYTESRPDGSTEVSDGDWSNYEGFSVFHSQGLIWYIKAVTKKSTRTCADFENGACTIWKQDVFSAICRYWPVHPDNLECFPDCGFGFTKVKPNTKDRRI